MDINKLDKYYPKEILEKIVDTLGELRPYMIIKPGAEGSFEKLLLDAGKRGLSIPNDEYQLLIKIGKKPYADTI